MRTLVTGDTRRAAFVDAARPRSVRAQRLVALALPGTVSRPVWLRVGAERTVIGRGVVEIAVASLFEELPLPRVPEAVLRLLRERPAAIETLSCLQPVVLTGDKDVSGRYIVIAGRDTFAIARRLAVSTGVVAVHGFVLDALAPLDGGALAARLLAWWTGLTTPLARGRVAELVWSRLPRESGPRVSRASVAALVGVSRQALGRRSHSNPPGATARGRW